MMMKQYSSVLMIFIVVVSVNMVNASEFPSDLPRCTAGDVDCLTGAMNYYIQHSAQGIPSVGIESWDPLFVPTINIIQSTSSPVNIKLNCKNVNILGYSHLQFSKIVGFERNPKKSKFELYGIVPRLSFVGDYSINGNILIFPIVGNGLMNMTLDNIEFHLKLKTKVEERDGEDYLHINKVNVNFNTSRIHIKFDNLFNGDQVLTETTNSFLNDNWRDMYAELRPALQNTIATINRDMIQSVMDKFPYSHLWL